MLISAPIAEPSALVRIHGQVGWLRQDALELVKTSRVEDAPKRYLLPVHVVKNLRAVIAQLIEQARLEVEDIFVAVGHVSIFWPPPGTLSEWPLSAVRVEATGRGGEHDGRHHPELGFGRSRRTLAIRGSCRGCTALGDCSD